MRLGHSLVLGVSVAQVEVLGAREVHLGAGWAASAWTRTMVWTGQETGQAAGDLFDFAYLL